MRKILVAMVIVASLTAGGVARAQGKAIIDLQSLLGAFSYNFDDGKFTGEGFGFTIRGTEPGDVTVALENEQGKRVFERTIPCPETYVGDDIKACALDSSSQSETAKPYAVKSGPHTVRFLMNGVEIYSLKLRFRVDDQGGSKSVFTTGDWYRLALLETPATSGIRAGVFIGGLETCGGGDGVDAQILLYRDGEYVARGHQDGLLSEGCDTGLFSVALFTEDENHMTKWLMAEDVTKNNGNYELVFYKNAQPVKTFAFTVSDGAISSSPPAGLENGLLAENIYNYTPAAWVYEK